MFGRVSNVKFLWVHINLTWTHHTDFITRSATCRPFFLCRQRSLNNDTRIPNNLYRCTIQSILIIALPSTVRQDRRW